MTLIELALLYGIMVCAIYTVLVINPVYNVLGLILLFCLSSIYLFILGLDYFAILLLMIYVGAVAVLFLFIVMLFHFSFFEKKLLAVALIPFLGLLFLIPIMILLSNFLTFLPQSYSPFGLIDIVHILESNSLPALLGQLLYSGASELVILIAIILLAAMLGSILLTFSGKKKQ